MIDQLHDLVLKLAPELGSQPLYIMEPPADLPMVGCGGVAFPGGSAIAKRDLVESGRWSGPGPMICIPPGYNEADLHGVLIHECSHLLPFVPVKYDPEPTAEVVAAELSIGAFWDGLETKHRAQLEPWLRGGDHGLSFIRNTLHLMHRANLLGVPMSVVVGGFWYELRNGWFYRDALGDEPARCVDMTFAEIAATPMPDEFVKVFCEDVLTWEEKQNEHRND